MARLLNLDHWAGRWVAVAANGEVVADAESMAVLYSDLERAGIVDVEIMRALRPHQPVAYGLG